MWIDNSTGGGKIPSKGSCPPEEGLIEGNPTKRIFFEGSKKNQGAKGVGNDRSWEGEKNDVLKGLDLQEIRGFAWGGKKRRTDVENRKVNCTKGQLRGTSGKGASTYLWKSARQGWGGRTGEMEGNLKTIVKEGHRKGSLRGNQLRGR